MEPIALILCHELRSTNKRNTTVRSMMMAAVCVAAGLVLASCAPNPKQASPEEPPLLLDDAPALAVQTGGADNSRCFVCHINYAAEKFAVRHAKANISCSDCHGKSDAHCSNEDNIVPPDRMYPREIINLSCMGCHPRDKISAPNHQQVLADVEDKTLCTDCHGKDHRLAHRTRRWDKATGKLIYDDNVRMSGDTQ